jgi:uncharacterized repeat protein (TIGR03803 family)
VRFQLQPRTAVFEIRLRVTRLAMALFALALLASQAAIAQTLTALHTFSGRDGQAPLTGLTMDRAGNLYGTTYYGGSAGFGTVFKLTYRNSNWIFALLYSFRGGDDGALPEGRVAIGPDGSLYGTTTQGGSTIACYGECCGTVYNLRPPASVCRAEPCLWSETVLHRFADIGSGDGVGPMGNSVFDQAGNLYGVTAGGGATGNGAVYEMTRSTGWAESVIFSFETSGGAFPNGGVIFDRVGNLYGTTDQGGAYSYGTVYQLTHSGS